MRDKYIYNSCNDGFCNNGTACSNQVCTRILERYYCC